MGFRFRKSINLGGGFRVNMSKSGIVYSYGMKGFRVIHSARGTLVIIKERREGKKEGLMYIPRASGGEPFHQTSYSVPVFRNAVFASFGYYSQLIKELNKSM